MYYKDENNQLFVSPASDMVEKQGLISITKAEFSTLLGTQNAITEEQLTLDAQTKMRAELEWVDLQLKYHASGDTGRACSTVDLLYDYAIQCRDYVQNIDGQLVIMTEEPVRPE